MEFIAGIYKWVANNKMILPMGGFIIMFYDSLPEKKKNLFHVATLLMMCFYGCSSVDKSPLQNTMENTVLRRAKLAQMVRILPESEPFARALSVCHADTQTLFQTMVLPTEDMKMEFCGCTLLDMAELIVDGNPLPDDKIHQIFYFKESRGLSVQELMDAYGAKAESGYYTVRQAWLFQNNRAIATEDFSDRLYEKNYALAVANTCYGKTYWNPKNRASSQEEISVADLEWSSNGLEYKYYLDCIKRADALDAQGKDSRITRDSCEFDKNQWLISVNKKKLRGGK